MALLLVGLAIALAWWGSNIHVHTWYGQPRGYWQGFAACGCLVGSSFFPEAPRGFMLLLAAICLVILVREAWSEHRDMSSDDSAW